MPVNLNEKEEKAIGDFLGGLSYLDIEYLINKNNININIEDVLMGITKIVKK